jgi:hypothetical protein
MADVSGGSASNPTAAIGGTGNVDAGGSGVGATTSMGGAGTVGGNAPQGGQQMVGGNTSAGGTGGGSSGPTCPKPAGQLCHEFIANDNGRAQVNYVNEFTSKNAGGVVWSKNVGHAAASPENSPRTIEIVDNAQAMGGKAVLVSVNDGYVELDLSNGNKLADVTVQFNGITGACRLPDGTTALGTNASIRIVNAAGVQARSFNLPAGSNLRAINRDPATGNFWLSKTENAYQLNDQGQILWQGFMGAGTKGYAVWWRQGGGAYGTTGEPATIVELNAEKQIVATIGGRDKHPEAGLDFFSGFVRRPNGNFIVANWLGHLGNPGANTAQIVELTPDDKVVWTWGNQTLSRQITNVYVFQ